MYKVNLSYVNTSNGHLLQIEESKVRMNPNHKLVFFNEEIDVEHSSSQSSQAIVFFGREQSLRIRVVVKQYRGCMLKAIMVEMKIFTLIDAYRKK
jgi:hypothetical protein